MASTPQKTNFINTSRWNVFSCIFTYFITNIKDVVTRPLAVYFGINPFLPKTFWKKCDLLKFKSLLTKTHCIKGIFPKNRPENLSFNYSHKKNWSHILKIVDFSFFTKPNRNLVEKSTTREEWVNYLILQLFITNLVTSCNNMILLNLDHANIPPSWSNFDGLLGYGTPCAPRQAIKSPASDVFLESP